MVATFAILIRALLCFFVAPKAEIGRKPLSLRNKMTDVGNYSALISAFTHQLWQLRPKRKFRHHRP